MGNQILVIGGTGTTGRALVEKLKENQANFKALVRNEEKAASLNLTEDQKAIGVLGNWESVGKALQGTDTVFLLTGAGPSNVEDQNGLIDRAKASGVRKVVKISAVGANTGSEIHLADWHGQIEDHLKSSGMNYVILRPHSFMQNILMNLPTIKEQGVFYQSMGNGKIPFVDTRDIAEAAYCCLLSDEFNNGTYDITGPQALSYDEFASALSSATKKQISSVAIPPDAHNGAMRDAGVPDWLADDLTKMSSYWSQATLDPSSDYNKLTGKQQRTVQQFAGDYASYFK